jgi:hypothetical protein
MQKGILAIHCYSMIMKNMADRDDLQFNVGPGLW